MALTCRLIVLQAIVVLVCCMSFANATEWAPQNFTVSATIELPTPSNGIGATAMAVDNTTTPYTAYFAMTDPTTGLNLFKYQLNDTTIGSPKTNAGLYSVAQAARSMVLDTKNKMLYVNPESSLSVIKINAETLTYVSTIELSDVPASIPSSLKIGSPVLDQDNGYLFYSVSSLTKGYVVRVHLDIFNTTSSSVLEFNDTASLDCGVLDPYNKMAYFASRSVIGVANVAQVSLDTADYKLVSYKSFSAGFLPVSGCSIDVTRQHAYFASSNNPSRIARVSIGSTFDIDKETSLSYGERAPKALLLDSIGGSLYLGTMQGTSNVFPGATDRVVRVDLKAFQRDSHITMAASQVNLKSGAIDPVERTAYFGTVIPLGFAWKPSYKDYLIKVLLPTPCGSDSSCSGHGICSYGSCDCSGGVGSLLWSGTICNTLTCHTNDPAKVCSGCGACNNGTCICTTDSEGHFAFGEGCMNVTCAGQCSGHGTCNQDTLKCSCTGLWTGSACHIAIPPRPPCDSYATCDQCFKDPECGYCSVGTTKGCRDGTFVAPSDCLEWYYDSCPNMGIIVFSWLIVALTCLLIVIGGCTAIGEDMNFVDAYDDENTLPDRATKQALNRKSWWRASRTLKSWWMMDRLQVAAVVAFVGTPIPSVYMEFVRPLAWTVLGATVPSFITDIFKSTGLTGSLTQFATMLSVPSGTGASTALFTAAVFYFAIVFGGLGILLLFVSFVGYFFGLTEGTEEGPPTLPTRIPSILGRVVLFSYMGLSATAAATAFGEAGTAEQNGGLYGLAIIVLVILGLVLPIALFVVFFRKATQKKQFLRKFRMRYGCFYEALYFKKAWFIALILWKKFFVAVFIGSFSALSDSNAIAGGVVLLATAVIYVEEVLRNKPFLDPAMRNLELLGAVADILAGIFVFLWTPSMGIVGTATVSEFSKRNTIAVLLIIVQVVWVVLGAFAFFENWLKVYNVHSYAQLFRKVSGKQKPVQVSGPIMMDPVKVQDDHLE